MQMDTGIDEALYDRIKARIDTHSEHLRLLLLCL
jgi:hypothetical protein